MSKSPKEIKKELELLKTEYKESAQTEFHNTCKVLFEKYSRLKSFGFYAYTPYFADGDECIYSACTDSPTINGFDEYGDEYGDEDKDTKFENLYFKSDKTTGYGNNEKPNPDYDKSASEIVEAVKDLLAQYGDDFYFDLVGDHVKVIITSEGLETEEHEHD